ncbi:hypothetical protein OQ252_06165 [Acetobacter farinalis]|uniref:ABC transporter permease n=1 Tax=Acetobacter farinalis TaxID=1260984 RepID=A0ABT3Q6S7_9PROT|nr:hypothetical protein [Acetobacter farinalis]MCX2560981.1 hypothetical protein [Acetobacter farinalis]NHO29769.1 hypothetical protein [Acetobacter farinalis]
MIPRPFTCCCAVLAIASGFFLYTKKHQTTLLDQQISKIVSDTERVRAQTAMLRTEWALENQPERLTRLAEHHLTGLHAMDPAQFVRMADLSAKLPTPVPATKPAVADPRAGMIAATLASAQPTPSATAPVPAPQAAPRPAVVAVAEAKPAHVAPHHDTVAEDETSPAPRAVVAVADEAPARPAPAMRAVAHRAPRPVMDDAEDAPVRTAQVLSAPAARDVTPRPVAPRRAAPQIAEAARSSQPIFRTPAPVSVASVTPAQQPAPVTRHAQSAPVSTRVAVAAPRNSGPGNSGLDSDAETQVRHPLPVTVASWHAARPRRVAAPSADYVEARATTSYSSGSLLSHSGDALPAPVPMTN